MNSKHTKRALLSSALALVLCFTMLIGTTFAWFTDTASTNVNTIQAGTLKVALEMYENGQWVDAEGKTLNFTRLEDAPATVSDNANEKVLVQSADILWEPGCTYKLPTLRVRNDGNLALKYKIEITGINGDAKLNEAIEWTIDKGLNEALVEGTTDQWFLLAGNESGHDMVISGHMKESAGNEYQGLSIEGVAITVYATQYTYEYDMNGNQYDADAKYDEPWDGKTKTAPALVDGVYHITNAAELVFAMEHSDPQMIGYNGNEYVFGKYVLESNIDLGGATVTGFACNGTNFRGSFDGQGYTISNFTIDNAAKTYYGGLFGYLYGATVENLTVKNAVVIGKEQVGVLVGAVSDNSTVTNCNVYNSTVIATKKVGAVAGYALNSTVTNCYAENCNVYYSIKDAAAVLGYENTGCTVSGNDDKNVTVKQANGITVSNAADLKTALATQGSVVALRSDIKLTEALTTADNVVIEGNGYTISGYPVRAGKNTEIRNVVFDAPVNDKNDASNLYCNNGSITIDGCTFKTSQWDSVQITPKAGDAVVIKNCTFIGSTKRFIHVEVNDSTCTTNVSVTLSNNSFASSAGMTDDVIGIYGIDESGINYGGNNTFADTDGIVWIGWRPNTYADNQADVYAKLTGANN